jgi:hypothetical protein
MMKNDILARCPHTLEALDFATKLRDYNASRPAEEQVDLTIEMRSPCKLGLRKSSVSDSDALTLIALHSLAVRILPPPGVSELASNRQSKQGWQGMQQRQLI